MRYGVVLIVGCIILAALVILLYTLWKVWGRFGGKLGVMDMEGNPVFFPVYGGDM